MFPFSAYYFATRPDAQATGEPRIISLLSALSRELRRPRLPVLTIIIGAAAFDAGDGGLILME